MGGAQHRRYRALVQPSFVPAKAQWWIDKWIERDRRTRSIDSFVDEGRPSSTSTSAPPSRCSRSPGASASTSTRRSTSASSSSDPARGRRDPRADRRGPARAAGGRPHQRAGRGRDHRRGRRHPPPHRRRDPLVRRCCCSRPGPGTTWKQMGITLAALLERPEVLAAVRDDRALLRPAIEESVRWEPTDPMFSPLGHPGHRARRRRPPAGLGAPPLPRRRQPRPRAVGAARRVRHHAAAEAVVRASAAGRTSASACTSPGRR